MEDLRIKKSSVALRKMIFLLLYRLVSVGFSLKSLTRSFFSVFGALCSRFSFSYFYTVCSCSCLLFLYRYLTLIIITSFFWAFAPVAADNNRNKPETTATQAYLCVCSRIVLLRVLHCSSHSTLRTSSARLRFFGKGHIYYFFSLNYATPALLLLLRLPPLFCCRAINSIGPTWYEYRVIRFRSLLLRRPLLICSPMFPFGCLGLLLLIPTIMFFFTCLVFGFYDHFSFYVRRSSSALFNWTGKNDHGLNIVALVVD